MGTHVYQDPGHWRRHHAGRVELSVWHVKVGDMVVEDQVLADVMTDKKRWWIFPRRSIGKVIALGGRAW